MIRIEPWSDKAERSFERSAGSFVGLLKKEVESGNAHLWHFDEGTMRGFIVVRVEEVSDDWRELVFICTEGKNLLPDAIDILWQVYRKSHDVTCIRSHTQHKGMVRLCNRNRSGLSFRVREVIIEGVPDGTVRR